MRVRIADTLGLPPQAEVEIELLKLLASRSRLRLFTEVYRLLADTFGLTSSQRVARREVARPDPAWNWLVRRAMQRIQKEGWAYPRHGQWAATAKGRTLQRSREQFGTKVVGVVEHDLFEE